LTYLDTDAIFKANLLARKQVRLRLATKAVADAAIADFDTDTATLRDIMCSRAPSSLSGE
jgi:hypothetical protein